MVPLGILHHGLHWPVGLRRALEVPQVGLETRCRMRLGHACVFELVHRPQHGLVSSFLGLAEALWATARHQWVMTLRRGCCGNCTRKLICCSNELQSVPTDKHVLQFGVCFHLFVGKVDLSVTVHE